MKKTLICLVLLTCFQEFPVHADKNIHILHLEQVKKNKELLLPYQRIAIERAEPGFNRENALNRGDIISLHLGHLSYIEADVKDFEALKTLVGKVKADAELRISVESDVCEGDLGPWVEETQYLQKLRTLSISVDRIERANEILFAVIEAGELSRFPVFHVHIKQAYITDKIEPETYDLAALKTLRTYFGDRLVLTSMYDMMHRADMKTPEDSILFLPHRLPVIAQFFQPNDSLREREEVLSHFSRYQNSVLSRHLGILKQHHPNWGEGVSLRDKAAVLSAFMGLNYP